MAISVDIRPEVQAELARQAACRGAAIEDYLAALIEEAVQLPAAATRQSRSNGLREVFEAVRGLADDVDFGRNPSTGRRVDLS
jgi:hypothetical protein